MSHELKRWCLSQLKDMDVRIPAKAQYYKLLPSPSVEQSVADADLESLPLLSVISGDSSTSLATYVNILPSKSIHSLRGLEQDHQGSRTYFEMKVDRSPGMSMNRIYKVVKRDYFEMVLSSVVWLLSLQHCPHVSGTAHRDVRVKQTMKTQFHSREK